MPCDRLTSLTGCNTCKFHVGDNTLLKILRPEAIARVCLYIVRNDIISEKIIDYDNIMVLCSGSITFNEKITDITDTYLIFRQNVLTCGKIIDKWCRKHFSELNTIVGCTMINVSSNIDTLSNIYALREYFTKLVKYLRDITICNKICDTITINKMVSNCEFIIGDNKDLRKLDDPIVVLEALRQAIHAYKVSTIKKAYINISCIKIKCDGTIILPSEYIYTDTPEDNLIKKCVGILNEWIYRHRYHRMNIYIVDIIDSCRKVKNIKELYTYIQKGIGCIEGFTFFD